MENKFKNQLSTIKSKMEAAGLKSIVLYGNNNLYKLEGNPAFEEEVDHFDDGDSLMDMYTFNLLHGDWAERWCQFTSIHLEDGELKFGWEWLEYSVSGDYEDTLDEGIGDFGLICDFAQQYKDEKEAEEGLGKALDTIVEEIDWLVRINRASI